MEENIFNPDEKTEEKSFAELLGESQFERKSFKPGEKIDAVIVNISPEWIFIDLGGKTEGYLDRQELMDRDGNLTVKEGDTLSAYFLSSERSEKLFTTKVGGESARTYLEEAWANGIPLEGIVDKETKGGFEVKIAGSLRGFCPYSQMSLKKIHQASDYVGKSFLFTISEYGENGRNLILSRRSILEEEQKKRREELKGILREGMLTNGTVTSIQKFGAFVDIGGIQGLLPISEIGWDRTEDIEKRFTVGQEVQAIIIKLDWAKDRITLSLKETLPDPWENIEEKFPGGSYRTGTVSRLTDFGAFVTLEPGVDGLIHISKLNAGKQKKHARQILSKDQSVEVKIESVDPGKRRISLALADAGEKEEEKTQQKDDYRKYTGKDSRSFGSLGDLLKQKAKKK
jgi:small subunit ribosomal protein S1